MTVNYCIKLSLILTCHCICKVCACARYIHISHMAYGNYYINTFCIKFIYFSFSTFNFIFEFYTFCTLRVCSCSSLHCCQTKETYFYIIALNYGMAALIAVLYAIKKNTAVLICICRKYRELCLPHII